MLFTFGAAYSAEEKSCADEQKRDIKKQDIDKLNIFTTLKFPDITEIFSAKVQISCRTTYDPAEKRICDIYCHDISLK
jgi:hypothetical protein